MMYASNGGYVSVGPGSESETGYLCVRCKRSFITTDGAPMACQCGWHVLVQVTFIRPVREHDTNKVKRVVIGGETIEWIGG